MEKKLTELNKLTGVTLYLCKKDTPKMAAFQDGKMYEGDTPQWMKDFSSRERSILEFEQNGSSKCYLKLHLDESNMLVILDEPNLNSMSRIVTALSSYAGQSAESATDTQIAYLSAKLAEMEKEKEKVVAELKELGDSADMLKAQNADQAARLKTALSENLDLQKILKEQGGADSLRSTLTLLRDENARLKKYIKELEEKLSKVGGTAQQEEEEPHKLFKIVTALNKIISTGSARHIDLDALSMVVQLPEKNVMEKSPDAVKAIISQLLGLERSGRLTDFQIKRLNSSIKE